MEDTEYNKHLGKSADTRWGRVFLSPSNSDPGNGAVECPKCRMLTNMRVCPVCHCELPPEFGRLRTEIVCIIGEAGAGKSTYMGVGLPYLRDEALRRLSGGTFNERCEHTAEVLRNAYVEPLRIRRKALDPTRTEMVDGIHSVARQPLVFRLQAKYYYPGFYPLGEIRDYNVVVSDVSGEVFRNQAQLANYYRCLPNASCLIVLINPRSIKGIAHRLPNYDIYRHYEGSHQSVLNTVITFFEARNRLKRALPVALVITSSDLLLSRDLIDAGHPIANPKPHRGRLDVGYCTKRSKAIKALLQEWGEGAFCEVVKANFPTHCFFAVSSLGHAPTIELDENGNPTQKLGEINSWGLEDPFLWLFHKLGRMVPGS